jgi:hypothetical protein
MCLILFAISIDICILSHAKIVKCWILKLNINKIRSQRLKLSTEELH